MPLPTYLQIEPVGQCNLRCQMCPIQYRTDGPPHGALAFMEFETFVRILDEFEGLRELHLQGLGEPTMHPRFFDMVRFAVGRGIRVTTNTNATLITDKRAEQCVTSGLECLHASLDGARAETFERIRVRANFAKVVKNLERFRDVRERMGSKRPALHIVVVAMRQNLAEFADLVRLASRLGAEEVFVQQLCHDFGESSLPGKYQEMRQFVDDQTLQAEDAGRIESSFSEARRAAEETGIKLRLPRVRPLEHAPGTPGRERCSWPWTGAYISYQGYMMPCCMVSTPDRVNFGNVTGRSIADVWNSGDFNAFRAQLESGQPPEICQTCSIYLRTF
ncbi:MAG: radical SAM protein [Acidobacteria bacterium]|nr:MAG: radical SAM protein [Acidobacteriota bacterium]